jgi:hypothetical protein
VDIRKGFLSNRETGLFGFITVIASEAKQSMGQQSKRGLLRFARNDEA